jgi:hypothetical protein
MLASGMPHDSLEYQVFAHARPGTSDTSAIPNDQISNPGTINAIINLAQRPTFAGEMVDKWRKVAACRDNEPAAGANPGATANAGARASRRETVHHILKGGEDSIGANEAIQRVYSTSGRVRSSAGSTTSPTCANSIRRGRNFGQTPFDIGQCRRDCPNFRAIEDRLDDIAAFLHSRETNATDPAGCARERAQGQQAPAPAIRPMT